MTPAQQMPPQVGDQRLENSEDVLDIRQFLGILRRYKWSILGLSAAVAALAGMISLTLPPEYSSRVTILIDANRSKPVSIETVYGEVIDDQFYQTQVEILRSRQVIERVVRTLGVTPEQLAPPPQNSGLLNFKAMLPEWLVPAPPSVTVHHDVDVAIATAMILANLEIVQLPNSQLVSIGLLSFNPELAASIPNQIAETYIDQDLEARMAMVKKASTWLTANLSGLRDKLEASERALQEFRDRENLVDVGGVQSVSASQLKQISTGLVDIRRQRAEAETLFRQTRALRNSPLEGLESVPTILRHPLVQSLKQGEVEADRQVKELSTRYGPKHPKMIAANENLSSARRKLKSQILSVVDGIETDYRVAVNNERALSAELGESAAEVQEVSKKEYEYSVLEREVTTNKQLYDLFLTRFKETNVAGDFQTTIARVIDPALVPSSPIRPRKKMIVMLSFFIAALVGFLLALLRDHLDNTLKSTDDVERALGLPALGVVPLITGSGTNRRTVGRALIDKVSPAFSEAIKSIRTGVMLSGLDVEHRIVLVTSAVPGEGKTTVSSNLAVALGQMEKVLLIDADMRRPAVAKSLGIDEKHPGLAEFVANVQPFESCIVHHEDAGIDVLPAGSPPPNPLEMLSSKRFKSTLAKLAEHYDRIVIDAPPESAVSDPLILSKYASGVILVVKVDATPQEIISNAVKKLQRVDAPLLGVVLNQYAPKKHGYYGGRYYGKRYYTQYQRAYETKAE